MKFFFSLFLLLPVVAFAEVSVENAWARATAPGMPMGAVYAKLVNESETDLSLVSIETNAARLAEVHESIEIDGMMRMREISPFIVPANGEVSLQPGGKHLMLMGVKNSLQQGEYVTLMMTFSDDSQLEVRAIIGGFGQMEMPEA